VLLAAIFIISLCVSGVLFFKLPFRKVIKGGIFPQYVDMEGPRENIEKEYYDLQEKLQKKISELSSKLGSAEDGYSVLGSISSLIKESSAIKETEKAQQGLISHLNTPGLGLEKGEGEETAIILKNFVDKKAALNLKRTIDDMMNALKENPFNIKARITIGALANKIQNSNSPQQLSEYEKQLKEAIDNSSLDTSVKKELKELARQLKEWKGFQLQQRKMYSEGKIFEKEEIKEALVEQILPPPAKEYPQALEKYPQTKSPSFNLAVTLDLLIKIALKWVLILILCIPILFLVLYFLTEKQKNKLISLCKNPREFIINLYGNLRGVLIIFGSRYSGILAPLSYAEWVEHRYSIKNNLFLQFTAKFEEAKYSQHILKSEDVSLVLNDYNDFLKILFSNQKKFYLVLRYCLTLLHRKPLSIHKG
jgi:hypothetical protein